MEKLKILMGLLLISGGLPLVQAEPAEQDGHKLYQACQKAQVPQDGVANKDFDYDDYYAVGYCDGMVQGVSEALANQKRYCLPEDIRFPQLTKLVADYLEAHPGQRNQTASQAAYNAFLSAYPCMPPEK